MVLLEVKVRRVNQVLVDLVVVMVVMEIKVKKVRQDQILHLSHQVVL